MSLREEIINKTKEILDNAFDVEDVTYVPDITNSKLTFGNTGLQFEATVLYIDMRDSTEILNKHNNPVVAKIHMVYFHALVKIVKDLEGDVRSFNGDSLLVFFQGTTKRSLSNAVKAAMQIKYMLSDKDKGINSYLEKYSAINYGIGLDDGNILCTKIGLAKDANKQDLIWIGNPVNRAVKISDECKLPYSIGISTRVYENLLDDVKYSSGTNMWQNRYFQYNGRTEQYYVSSYHWPIE
jgi:adenylate cyclase